MLVLQSPADAHAVEPALQKLRSFLAAIDEDPNLDLDGPIKKLRQVCVSFVFLGGGQGGSRWAGREC